MNLLGETILALEDCGKTSEDVSWVGLNDKYFWWNEFAKVADFDYDSGHGIEEINMDLFIVGDNWWLERYEHAGLENWEFKTLPKREKRIKVVPIKDYLLRGQ